MTEQTISAQDWDRIIADLRTGDAKAERQAYRQVFGGAVGAAVLAHILAQAGVGTGRGQFLSGEQRAWQDGRADEALAIAARVGFDHFSAVVAVMTDNLEGQQHGQTHDGHDGPSPAPALAPD